MNSVLNSNIEDIRELKRILFDLRLKYDTIDNEDLKADIKAIIQIGDKLYSELILDNRKTAAAYRFIHNYLPVVDRIVEKYNKLVVNDIKSRDSVDLKEEIRNSMPKIKESLKTYYESMFTSEILDIDVELEVLLKQL
jgi:rubrerythrin